jgi:putative Holliday junction resolvase
MLINMRLLGIDYGSKRVGIAVSDDQGMMAFPREVLRNSDTLIDSILDLVDTQKISTIVIGHSKNREGGTNPIHNAVESFIEALKQKTSVSIVLEPEHYTTQEAVRFQGKTEHTDASAAAIILNSYITRTHNAQSHD